MAQQQTSTGSETEQQQNHFSGWMPKGGDPE